MLTAAHCVAYNEKGYVLSISVELGQHYRNPRAIIVLIPLAQVLIHPDYNNPQNHSNDLALLKLYAPVNFNSVPHVRPVCLPSKRNERFAGLRATVAGWGTTSVGGESSDVSLETEVNVISVQNMGLNIKVLARETQVVQLSTIFPLSDILLLIGGPVMIGDNRTSSYTMIGAVSWGWEDCTSQTWPGVHARITSNIGWITDTTARSSTCPLRADGDQIHENYNIGKKVAIFCYVPHQQSLSSKAYSGNKTV